MALYEEQGKDISELKRRYLNNGQENGEPSKRAKTAPEEQDDDDDDDELGF